MSAIDDLRRQVAAKQDAEAERKQQQAEQAAVRVREEWEQAVGKDLLEELAACADTDSIVLLYRGKDRRFRLCSLGGKSPCQAVLSWVQEVDDWYLEREAQRAKVLADLADCSSIYDSMTRKIREWDLGEDIEVAVALSGAEERIAQAKLDQKERDREAHQAATRAMVAQLEQVNDYSLPDVPWSLDTEPEVVDALNRAEQRVKARMEECKAQRDILQANVFEPFVWYKVCYAMVAEDDGERYADWQWIASLTDTCDDDGWWHPVQKVNPPVRLADVFRIERIEVRETSEMPAWCPRQGTEFGVIRLVPEGAQRL